MQLFLFRFGYAWPNQRIAHPLHSQPGVLYICSAFELHLRDYAQTFNFCLVTHRSSSKQLDKSMYSMAAQLAKFAPISSRSNIQLHWTHPTLTLIDFRSIKFSISLTLWAMSNECSQHIHSFYAIHFSSHHDMMVVIRLFLLFPLAVCASVRIIRWSMIECATNENAHAYSNSSLPIGQPC